MKTYSGQLPPWIIIIFTLIFAIGVLNASENKATHSGINKFSSNQYAAENQAANRLGGNITNLLITKAKQ